MFYRSPVFAAALIIAAFNSACTSKEAKGPPARFAVLRFENLTSDPSLNWMGRAASEILIREIDAIPSRTIYKANEGFGRRSVSSPGVSTELTDALLAGANRIVTGYVEQVNGKLLLTAVDEDAQTGRTLHASTAEGSLFEACAALARQFSSNPKPYSTNSETALRAFMHGMESGGTDSYYEQAAAADPKYADAYLAWSETALAQGDAAAVARILSQAHAHQLSDAIIAKIEFASATVNKDPVARVQALKRIVETDPKDISAVEALANVELMSHHFPEAAAIYAKAASATRPDLLNLQSYALMFGGNESAAMSAVREYQKASSQDPNAIDTEGDIQFYFGHFAEAEKVYLRAAAKDPQFNQGAENIKAARARLMTGDVAGANQVFSTYRTEREKAKDPSISFRAAVWQYATGEQSGAIDAMHKVAESATNASVKTLALTQAAIWELHRGTKTQAIQDAEAVLKMPQDTNTLAAAVVRFAAQDPAPVPELVSRAERMFKGPIGARFQQEAVAYALLFGKKYPEAAPFWKRIYHESNPNDQSIAFIYIAALVQSGQPADATHMLKANPLPLTTLAPSFECLYFPQYLRWRGDEATYLKLAGNTVAPAK